jgi:uncharacterized protein YidB (DUF937 family)
MSLLDGLAGKAFDMLSGSNDTSSGIVDEIMMMAAPGTSGGLNGLLQSFQDKGLGETVSSWIGTGENLPISPDQVQRVLGSETIQNLASKFGISSEVVSSLLAQQLPTAVDKLTPDGTLPEES